MHLKPLACKLDLNVTVQYEREARATGESLQLAVGRLSLLLSARRAVMQAPITVSVASAFLFLQLEQTNKTHLQYAFIPRCKEKKRTLKKNKRITSNNRKEPIYKSYIAHHTCMIDTFNSETMCMRYHKSD